ncbi:unnamed protein product [Caenorhabditis angaria]|uniref:Uncharacterized protein n=1 Tax=Caenorhabditis angaria TaxID=860376 RepID=A0A9P1N0N7_9PELO|nr:unnamed protein product [Caenorhabditis angaria]
MISKCVFLSADPDLNITIARGGREDGVRFRRIRFEWLLLMLDRRSGSDSWKNSRICFINYEFLDRFLMGISEPNKT